MRKNNNLWAQSFTSFFNRLHQDINRFSLFIGSTDGNVSLRNLLNVNVLTEIYFQWSKGLCPKSNKYYILPWWQTSDISITKSKFKLLLRKMTKISKIHLHNRNWRSFKDFIHLQSNLHNIYFFLSLRLSKTQLR